jgi:hypothetical protein
MERRNDPSRRAAHLATIDEQTARLRHLCRLMARDRSPRCALNGILVLIPFAATDSLQDATDTADAISRDLTAARAVLGVHCPVLSVVCDMESAPGFSEFVEQFSEKERLRRMGQRCPLVPGVPAGKGSAEAVEGMLRALAGWVCTTFMRQWIYQKCQLEKPGQGLEGVFATNSGLFLLLQALHERQGLLGKLLEMGFSRYAPADRLLFGGCYLAATGKGEDREEPQAFMVGVVERLIEGQSCVYWTDEVRQREAGLQSWVNTGWTILVVLLLGAAGATAVYLLR